jgi:fluoride ion exporter CrcB/FEX
MSRTDVRMGSARMLAAVSAGGAVGAALRVSVIELAALVGVTGWVAVAVVNVLGGLAIGAGFVHLEARFLRSVRSRLSSTPHAQSIEARGWILEADQTLDPVDLFRGEARLRMLSGYWVTGFLGGFTTFSSFAVELFELHGRIDPLRFTGAYLIAALLPVAATWAGLVLGAFTLPRRRPAGVAREADPR